MKKILFVTSFALGMVLIMANPSQAHIFGAHGAGFFRGILHPFGGMDHVSAMVAVGLWAGLMGSRARWMLPLAFVAMMTAGGAMGAADVPLPAVEVGIALSVLFLGSVVALNTRWPVAVGAGLVGLFAIFHGHVHGAEIPQAASWVTYPLGFVLATFLLHMAGVAAAAWLDSKGKFFVGFVRAGGGVIAVYGMLFLVGVY